MMDSISGIMGNRAITTAVTMPERKDAKDRNRDGICDSGYGIPGGHNTDHLPKASADAILQYKSKGLMGTVMKMDQKTYLPGDEIELKYSAPGNFSGWVGVVKADLPRGRTDRALAYSSQDIQGESGKANLKAPVANGSYDLRMYNSSSGEEMATLNFHVAIPTISASPRLSTPVKTYPWHIQEPQDTKAIG